MGLFDRMKEPVFLKESSNAEEQLEKLKALEPLLNSEGQAIIRQDIISSNLLFVITSLLIGGILYYLLYPDEIPIKYVDYCLGVSYHPFDIDPNNYIFRFVMNYCFDILWAYALAGVIFNRGL